MMKPIFQRALSRFSIFALISIVFLLLTSGFGSPEPNYNIYSDSYIIPYFQNYSHFSTFYPITFYPSIYYQSNSNGYPINTTNWYSDRLSQGANITPFRWSAADPTIWNGDEINGKPTFYDSFTVQPPLTSFYAPYRSEYVKSWTRSDGITITAEYNPFALAIPGSPLIDYLNRKVGPW